MLDRKCRTTGSILICCLIVFSIPEIHAGSPPETKAPVTRLSTEAETFETVEADGGTGRYDVAVFVASDIQDEGGGNCRFTAKEVFATTDPEVHGLILVRNAGLSENLDFRLQFFDPQGQPMGQALETRDAFSAGWERGWWHRGFRIAGQPAARRPGRYAVEFSVNGDRVAKRHFVVGWDLINHLMCKDAEVDDPWNYREPTHLFSPLDEKAVAWHEFENLAQDLRVKTHFYAPDGSLHRSGEPVTFHHDLPEGQWYDAYRYHQSLPIKGHAAEGMCGQWTVKLFVENPATGSWEAAYTDTFRIEEKTPPQILSLSANPDREGASGEISLSVEAADNHRLERIVLHWDDGTEHRREWTRIDADRTVEALTATAAPGAESFHYWAEVWDESGNRTASQQRRLSILRESVHPPMRLSGAPNLRPGIPADIAAEGAASDFSHEVQYQFDWGDGTRSEWGANRLQHGWKEEGRFAVRARARCREHTDRASPWSGPLAVTVDATPPVVSIASAPGSTFQSAVVVEGTSRDPDPGSGVSGTRVRGGASNQGSAERWRFSVPLGVGNNVITVRATDRSGNEGAASFAVTRLESRGDVVVDVEPDSLRTAWTLTGPAVLRVTSSGDQTLPDVPAGEYRLEWSPQMGWGQPSPNPEVQTLENGQTLTFRGTYVKRTGSLQVMIHPAEAVAAGARWCLDDGDWQDSGTTVGDILAGSHRVRFSEVPGWSAPGPRGVSVGEDRTESVEGDYRKAAQTP